jgi:uncharacterized damage-inducible protein DinB
MIRNDNVSLLLRIVDEAYAKSAWHGPNVRGAIRGLDVEAATWRPAPGRHNIREILLHIAYWKYIARRRMTGDRSAAFAFAGSDWFTREEAEPEAWREEIAIVESEHRALRAEVATLKDTDLTRKVGKGDLARLIYGAAAHDTYHCGQIGVLKRLQQER